MPKVLYLADILTNGGAERQLSLLVKYLPRECDRRVFSLGDGPFANVIRSNGIQVDICERKTWFDPSPSLPLWRLLAEWKPDVVHSWGWMSSVAAGFICKVLGIRFVDGTIRTGALPLRRVLGQRLGMVWARRIIANSQAGLAAWKIDPEKGRVVYNGFDPERLTLCDSLGEKPDETQFTVIMVAQMHPAKDYETFFNAIRLLIKKEDNWRFIGLGLGVLRESLMTQADELVKSGVLIFPEPTLEVLPYVKKANVGVLMTAKGIQEGISNAIMEYMACGLPVVCSEGGGNRELVVNEHTGFIIEPNNPAVLAERLLWLKEHPEIAHAMGQAGKEHIKREFTVEKMVANTLAVYNEMLTA